MSEEINEGVAVVKANQLVVYFVSGIAVFCHSSEDELGQSIAAVQLLNLNAVTKEELSRYLQVHTSTLYRHEVRVKKEGIVGLVSKKRGPKGPHSLTDEMINQAEELMITGKSIRGTAEILGITEGTIRHAIKQNLIRIGKPKNTGSTPSQRKDRDIKSEAGIAVKRHEERLMARTGELQQAAPEFQPSEAVNGAGVLTALPLLNEFGLFEVSKEIYGNIRNGFYGLQSMLVLLAFMALLRIKTPEQLSRKSPGEFGILLGLDRAPEVKTVRRKLHELAEKKRAQEFNLQLAAKWIHDSPQLAGLLYIDGHVKPYYGKEKLSKNWVSRLRLCAPAITDIWVNDIYADPLFVITTPSNEHFLTVIRNQILPALRKFVDDDQRRLTICFDREGWAPKIYKEISQFGFDVLTYRKGNYKEWPMGEFKSVKAKIDKVEIAYRLAEKEVEITRGFSMREIRRLCDTGHQTSILTTRRDLPTIALAHQMFSRWRQENFFKYMGEHFAFDHFPTHTNQAYDLNLQVINPERRDKEHQGRKILKEINKLQSELGRHDHDTERKEKDEIREQINRLQVCYKALRSDISKLPQKIALRDLPLEQRIVQINSESKLILDSVKMVAYKVETALLRMLDPFIAKGLDEGRALVREILTCTADIFPETNRLRISFHSLATRRANLALANLCEILNKSQTRYPDTNLIMYYDPPNSAKIIAEGQEV